MKFCFIFILLIVVSASSFASDSKSTPLTRLDEATKRMLEGLDENEVKQFAAIRNAYGVIHAVSDVEKNIDTASKSCSHAHTEFAKAMQTRVWQWHDDIDPVIADAKARLDTMVKLQDFTKAATVKSYLKKVDEAVAYKARGVKTIPITDKEDCHKLLRTMDDKQSDLKKLLIENLELDRPLAGNQQ